MINNTMISTSIRTSNVARKLSPNFSQTVSCLINAGPNIPSLQDLASSLDVAQSTVCRRLKREGTSYQQLKNNYRFNLAKYYLCHTSRTATEISYLIGFKETDAFFKVFKRWTQKTPTEFRECHASTYRKNLADPKA